MCMQNRLLKINVVWLSTILVITVCATAAVNHATFISLSIGDHGFGGKTLYVGGTGPNNYTKIQDAIDNASSGDTVFVYDDSSPYHENLFVNKTISLVGEDKNTTIIDGKKQGDVVYVSADSVNITGFTIRNSSISYPAAGVNIHSTADISSNFNRVFN
ncbi:MAG TPA: hypothetical protein EYP23_02545, partial [Thermoplasmata archaeon]|nr:hypothetical protein [Thermoplasmata archaeon]